MIFASEGRFTLSLFLGQCRIHIFFSQYGIASPKSRILFLFFLFLRTTTISRLMALGCECQILFYIDRFVEVWLWAWGFFWLFVGNVIELFLHGEEFLFEGSDSFEFVGHEFYFTIKMYENYLHILINDFRDSEHSLFAI